jgi:hypothetical protein
MMTAEGRSFCKHMMTAGRESFANTGIQTEKEKVILVSI